MDFTHPNNSSAYSRRKPAHRLRRVLLTLGILCLSLLLLIGLAPTLLSTTFARDRIVASINTVLPSGHISIVDWSFSWTQEQTLSGIHYSDPERHTDVSVSHIRLSSLWRLLPIGKITADISIEQPSVHIPFLPLAAPQDKPDIPIIEPATPTPSTTKRFILPAWDVALHLTITDAHLSTSQIQQPLLQKGNASLSFDAIDAPIHATFSALLLDVATSAEATLCTLAQWHTHGITPAILQKASLALDAPWIKTKLTMHHNPEEAFPTTALDLSLDAGAAFRLLRPLNLLPSNLNHLSGHLALTSTLRPAEAKRLHAICSLTSKALSCAYDGKTVTLSPALTADILFDPTQPLAAEIRQLKANAPGIAINGSGTLTNGALSVGFQSAPFWTAFAPLIGNYPLQYPVEATFEIRALSQQVEASLALHNANTRLGEATLKVDAFNPLDYTFKTLKLNTSWHLSPLAKVVGGLPETASLSGDLYANLAATGALNNLTANLAFSLQNIALATTAWSIREPLLAEGRSTLTLKEKQLTATNITLSSPIMTLLGNAQAHFEEHFPISADLKGTLSPSKVFKDWRIWGKNETPFKLDGTIDYTITAEKPNATLSLQTDLLSDTFTILPDKADAIPLPFNLNVNLLQSPSQLQLNACTFAMKGLSLTSTGAFCPDTGLLAIKGQLTPDFDTLFATLPPLAKQRDTFAVSGKHTRDFSFEAPLLQGLPGIFNYGKAAAELCFDTVTVPGLDIPQGLVSLTLQDGVVALNGDVQVNGGRVFIQPRLNLSGDTPVLFWKEQGKVLDNVHLTQALFDTALGGINPLLAGSANPSGSISLTCNHLYLPLTERFLSDLEASILLETNACQLKPNGAVQKVLAIVAKNDESLRLDDQKIALSITEGNLKADPITIRVENLKFICQGQTNLLTQAIHYTLTVPLNEKLVGKSLAKSIKAGETVTLPITGTIQKPQLDTSPLVQVFTETAVNRAKDKLSNKLERALQKRVTKQKAKPSSSSKASPKKDTDALEDALRSLFGN